MFMKRLIFVAAALAIPFSVHAAGEFKDCSMRGGRLVAKTELLKSATVKEDEAKRIALGTSGPGSTIVKGGIETERGCTVYSYHVKDPAKTGQTEVFVDAGNGVVLMQEQQGKLQSAIEKPVNKTKEVASRVKENVTGAPSTSHNKVQ
jgi:hypothetical protein